MTHVKALEAGQSSLLHRLQLDITKLLFLVWIGVNIDTSTAVAAN